EDELPTAAKELQSPLSLVRQVAAAGRLPVVLFCAGGIATPADASLVMQLGAEGVFVGSGIFKSEDPERRARAIVEATTHFRDPADVDGIDALIIPGGESTVITLGIEREGLAEPICALIDGGAPVLGTCAGMIMLDRDHLGVLDISTRRNAFGRQLRSFEA